MAVAALLAATGLATAQGVNQGGAKGSEFPAAASPKGDTAAPMNAPAAKGAETEHPALDQKRGYLNKRRASRMQKRPAR